MRGFHILFTRAKRRRRVEVARQFSGGIATQSFFVPIGHGLNACRGISGILPDAIALMHHPGAEAPGCLEDAGRFHWPT